MASIDIGGRTSGRKNVDANIPLVPILDLLLCCLMFLLVTAVWNSLASLSVSQRLPGEATADQVAIDELRLLLLVSTRGYEISTTAGDRVLIPKHGDEHDVSGLREKLARYRTAHPSQDDITVVAEDGVSYGSLIAALDAARAEKLTSITL